MKNNKKSKNKPSKDQQTANNKPKKLSSSDLKKLKGGMAARAAGFATTGTCTG